MTRTFLTYDDDGGLFSHHLPEFLLLLHLPHIDLQVDIFPEPPAPVEGPLHDIMIKLRTQETLSIVDCLIHLYPVRRMDLDFPTIIGDHLFELHRLPHIDLNGDTFPELPVPVECPPQYTRQPRVMDLWNTVDCRLSNLPIFRSMDGPRFPYHWRWWWERVKDFSPPTPPWQSLWPPSPGAPSRLPSTLYHLHSTLPQKKFSFQILSHRKTLWAQSLSPLLFYFS